MAKDLVRTRKYVNKFFKMKAQLQAVSLKLQTMKTTVDMTRAISGVTRVCILICTFQYPHLTISFCLMSIGHAINELSYEPARNAKDYD